MIQLSVKNLHAEPSAPKETYELLLRVVADFCISGCSETIYCETEFPVVELAASLHKWLQRRPRGEFAFESMDSDVIGLVWLRRCDNGCWSIGSAASQRSEVDLSEDELETAVRRFVKEVVCQCSERLGVDVEPSVRGGA